MCYICRVLVFSSLSCPLPSLSHYNISSPFFVSEPSRDALSFLPFFGIVPSQSQSNALEPTRNDLLTFIICLLFLRFLLRLIINILFRRFWHLNGVNKKKSSLLNSNRNKYLSSLYLSFFCRISAFWIPYFQ